jgi:hypothetical protein
MKRFCAFVITAIFVLGLAISPVFAGGDKQRGDEGQGPTEQNFCGPDDDCAGDPYWWE